MQEELQYYVENKGRLDLVQKNGMSLAPSYSGRVGIINQGSTCYLNSLIQCLFYNLQFRSIILQAAPDSAILIALQDLFAQLQLSLSAAIDTKALVTAFGWSRGQVFEQHDVHELFSLLIDALGDASTDLGKELSLLFEGSMTDVLLCPCCKYERVNTSAFLNISLEVSAADAGDSPLMDESSSVRNQSVDLNVLLENHMKTEILDTDNKWQCSGCNDRVQALKYHEYKALPSSLMVHLKRFHYNTTLRKREKIKTPVYFPCILDTSALMCGGANRSNTGFHESKEVSSDSSNTYSSSSSSTSECMDRGALYRLHSILLHTGTANGGHYKAYVMDGPTGKWLECNDSSVCELSPREEASLFSRKHASAATTATTIASAIVTATPNITPATDVNTAATDTTAAVTATPISGDCTGDCTVTDEIGVGGGSEGDTDDLKIPPFDSTDSPTSVRERTKKIVTLTDDILHENAYILLYSKLPKDAYKEISVADCIKTIDVPSTGEKVAATVLVDRCLAAIPVPLKDSILIKNEELKVLRRLYDVHRKLITFSVFYDNAEIAVVRGASLIDDAGKSEVKATNRNGLNCISMTVLNTDTLDDLLRQVCALLSIPLQSTAPQHFFRLRLYGEMSGRGGETYGSRGDEALSNLGFKVRTSFGPSVPSAPVVLRLECRTQDDAPFEEFSDRDMRLKIIVWSEAVERAVITCYDNDSELIENAAIVDSAVLLSDFNMDSPTSPSSNNTATIVVQAEVIEEATAPNVGLTEGKKPLDGPRTLNSAQYSKEVLLAATHEILVPGKLTATLGNLRQAVAILLEVESCDVILVFKSDRTVIELDIDQDHRSVGKAFGINPGDTLYTEINQSSQIASISEDVEIPSSSGRYRSSALNTLIRISSSITVKFDDPTGTKNKENNAIPDLDPNVDSNPVHDRTHTDDSDGTRTNFVKLSSHSTLKDLKSRISQKLKMCPVKDIFYLCKSSVAFAAQYKDESKSLSDLGMSDCTHVHIKMGKGCMPGEHLLRIDCEVDSAPVASLSVPLLVPAVVPIGGDKNALTGKLNVVVDGISSMVSSSSSSSRGANIDSTSGKESDTGSVSVSADISVSLVGSVENTAPQKPKTKMHPLCELIVRENSTVLSLKDQLFTDWDALRTETLIPEKPPTVHHIRLRDAKMQTAGSSVSGPILRNDRLLSRSLLGLTDGRRIVVQILREPEIIRPTDWIFSVRLATYSTSVKPLSPTAATTHSSSISGNQCIVEAKNISAGGDDQSVAFSLESSIEKTTEVSQKDQVCLSDPITLDEFTSKKVHRTADLPISRSATVRDLYAQILKLYPHLRDSTVRHSNIVSSVVAEKAEEGEVSSGNSESTAKKSTGDFFDRDVLSIAKGFTTGPPLTLKSSMKLSWDPAIIVNSPDLQIDHPSLGMRDGTLLVVRGDIDWKRYCKQLSGQESSGSVQPENDERTMSPVRAAAVIPPWKSKSILNKKKPMVSQTNTNTEYSSDTNTVVKSAGGTSTSRFSSGGGSTFRSRTVEKGLSLGSSACSRQAHLIQSALDLDSKVNQEEDPGSVVVSTEEFNSDIDCVGGVNNSTTTVHVKRTVDLDSVPPLPNCPSNDLLSYMSITSDTDVNNVDDPSFSGVGVSVGLMEQRMPIAPVEVIRALKDKDQSHIIDALHL